MKLLLENWRGYLNEELVYRGVSREAAEEAQRRGYPLPSTEQAINDPVVLASHFGQGWKELSDEEIDAELGIAPGEKFPFGINTSRDVQNAAGYAGKYEDDGLVVALDISDLGDEDIIEFDDGTVFIKDARKIKYTNIRGVENETPT
jgi:hypothetical protein